MEYVLLVVLTLLSPAILACSLLFPFYWIGQYRLLRRTGSWKEQRPLHDRWMGRVGRGILASYVLVLAGLLFPSTFPTVGAFLKSGGMLWVAVPVVLDVALWMTLPLDRAVELWKAERP